MEHNIKGVNWQHETYKYIGYERQIDSEEAKGAQTRGMQQVWRSFYNFLMGFSDWHLLGALKTFQSDSECMNFTEKNLRSEKTEINYIFNIGRHCSRDHCSQNKSGNMKYQICIFIYTLVFSSVLSYALSCVLDNQLFMYFGKKYENRYLKLPI